MARSLYIHIPFCQSRCIYCDFVSGIYDTETASAYLTALENEIRRMSNEATLSTIYIGGGTPTILPTEQLMHLMDTIKGHFSIAEGCEITIEANPRTVSREKLSALREAGINRLSIGAQSFDDESLRFLGRIHSGEDARKAVSDARATGFENIGIDLIYAMPSQDPHDWERDLTMAVELRPAHISAYELTVEEGTPLSQMIARGLSLPDEDTVVEMYLHAIDRLSSAGYVHYEISNFSLPSFECRHNLNYWDREEYLGAGLGAHSLIGSTRTKNTSSIERYIQADGDCIEEQINLSPEEEFSEAIFLGLRKTRGVCIEGLRKRYGLDILKRYGRRVEELLNTGLLEEAVSECSYETCLRLTRRGLVLSNEVFEKFL